MLLLLLLSLVITEISRCEVYEIYGWDNKVWENVYVTNEYFNNEESFTCEYKIEEIYNPLTKTYESIYQESENYNSDREEYKSKLQYVENEMYNPEQKNVKIIENK